MKIANVSVLMATYNREHFVTQSLNSLLNQTRPPKQIIVINDGSTDNTKHILESYSDKITYLEKPNGGKSSALNLGLCHAKGDYIWVFDDDDIAFPDAIERHLKTLESDHKIDFTYSTYCRGTTATDYSLVPGPDVRVLNIDPDRAFVKMLENCFMIQQSMLVRREAFMDVAPYDTELIRSQDYDFLLRLNRKYRGKMIEGPTFYRRYHSGARGNTNDVIHESEIDRKWFNYEKIAIKKQYEILELRDYLYKNVAYCHENKRLALLQRASIMAIKGLWSEFCQDLALLKLSKEYSQKPLNTAEKAVCQKALTTPFAIIELLNNPSDYKKVLNHLKTITIPGFRIEVAKSLYYSLTQNQSQFTTNELLLIVILIVKIAGINNLASNFLKK